MLLKLPSTYPLGSTEVRSGARFPRGSERRARTLTAVTHLNFSVKTKIQCLNYIPNSGICGVFYCDFQLPTIFPLSWNNYTGEMKRAKWSFLC